jgi:hypothetical protein
VGWLDDVVTAGSMWSEAHLERQSHDGFVRPSYLGEAVEVRADDMMPNADVRLAYSGKETLSVVVHARLKYKPHVIALGPSRR